MLDYSASVSGVSDFVYLNFMSLLNVFRGLLWESSRECALLVFALTSADDAMLIILFLFCLQLYDVLLSSLKRVV